MLSRSRRAAILQKLAGWVYDPTPGYTKAMSAPPGTRTGYAQDNSVAPSVNAAGLGGRRDPAAMAAMRTPSVQSAPPLPEFKDGKMFATGGFGSNAKIPGVRQ